MIEYFIGQEKSYAFCLTKEGLEVFPLPAIEEWQQKVISLQEKSMAQGQLTILRP